MEEKTRRPRLRLKTRPASLLRQTLSLHLPQSDKNDYRHVRTSDLLPRPTDLTLPHAIELKSRTQARLSNAQNLHGRMKSPTPKMNQHTRRLTWKERVVWIPVPIAPTIQKNPNVPSLSVTWRRRRSRKRIYTPTKLTHCTSMGTAQGVGPMQEVGGEVEVGGDTGVREDSQTWSWGWTTCWKRSKGSTGPSLPEVPTWYSNIALLWVYMTMRYAPAFQRYTSANHVYFLQIFFLLSTVYSTRTVNMVTQAASPMSNTTGSSSSCAACSVASPRLPFAITPWQRISASCRTQVVRVGHT